MRLGRIFLAGLAPLISLSALVTAMAAGPGVPKAAAQEQSAKFLTALLGTVAPFIVADHEIEPVSVARHSASPQAVLEFTALAATPLRRSLWLLASILAIPLYSRRHLPAPLRC